MKVLVVDDEPLARRRLIRMLRKLPGVEIAGEAASAREALDQIRADRPDAMLLDIRMRGTSGIDLAASSEHLPPIIFTTAYDQYAVQAFEISAVDYLLKPIRLERLAAAIEKVRQQSERAGGTRVQELLERLDRKVEREPSRLQARAGSTTRLFDANDISRIYASSKYAVFQHQDREFVLDDSLNSLETRLEQDGFFRVHRGELINLAHVRALQSEDGATFVELSDGQRASVSRRTVTSLKRKLGIR